MDFTGIENKLTEKYKGKKVNFGNNSTIIRLAKELSDDFNAEKVNFAEISALETFQITPEIKGRSVAMSEIVNEATEEAWHLCLKTDNLRALQAVKIIPEGENIDYFTREEMIEIWKK